MHHTQIINKLISAHGYNSYLEIGVYNPALNFDKITAEFKVGVDPDPNANASLCITSDAYFDMKPVKDGSIQHDIIFVDGLHHAYQIYRDVINCLKVLKEGGTIVCHDIIPRDHDAQVVPRKVKTWNGDCWMAWLWLRQREDLEMYVLDTDEGCGIIKRGKQTPPTVNTNITYENLVSHKREWLNIIPVTEWYLYNH